jgi:hypothetical protein
VFVRRSFQQLYLKANERETNRSFELLLTRRKNKKQNTKVKCVVSTSQKSVFQAADISSQDK